MSAHRHELLHDFEALGKRRGVCDAIAKRTKGRRHIKISFAKVGHAEERLRSSQAWNRKAEGEIGEKNETIEGGLH